MLKRKATGIILGIILIALGFAAGNLSISCSQGAMSKKYEYNIINYLPLAQQPINKRIEGFNKMGAEGWEFIGTMPEFIGTMEMGRLLVFKR